MKVAMLSPLPPARSGIADYSAELVPALGALCDLSVFSEDLQPKSSGMTARPLSTFAGTNAGEFDIALYQLGNSLFHETIYRAALRWPGVSVVHDPVMQHFISAVTERRGDDAAYFREMLASHGLAGAIAARRVLRGDGQIDADEFPLTGRIIDSSLALIVHSTEAAERLRRVRPDCTPTVVPLLIAPPRRISRKQAKERLGFKTDELLIGSFGLATPEKRFQSTVEALSIVARKIPDWRFLIVGEDTGVAAAALEKADPAVQSRSRITGRVDGQQYDLYQAAVDFTVGLRRPTHGESSAAVLRVMARGVPAIVNNAGTFRELPDDAVLKIAADDQEVVQLANAISLLATDLEERERRSVAAKQWVAREHSPERAAKGYLAALSLASG